MVDLGSDALVFMWKDCCVLNRLVDKVNKSIGQDPDSTTLVGVLDIYGFESFKVNRYVKLILHH